MSDRRQIFHAKARSRGGSKPPIPFFAASRLRVNEFQFHFALLITIISSSTFTFAAPPQRLPKVAPAEVGMSAEKLAEIKQAVSAALDEKKMPGCVVLIGRGDKIAFLEAYGQRQLEPTGEPMLVDTVFDLASLTKPIATATSVMILVERGKLKTNDVVSKHLPEFSQNGKEAITVEQLLIHQSGLIADNALADYQAGPEIAWERICQLRPTVPPNTKFIYSDVGFIVLGKLVEKLSGESLPEFARQNIFAPLGMTETGYSPDATLRARSAPTEKRNGDWIQGTVHDPRAYLLGGAAGHAGLFSTAEDVARYASAMAQRGSRAGTTLLSETSWTEMTAPRAVTSGHRTFGWDMKTGYSTNRGATMSDQAFGHGGFTGTGLWIDPATKLFVIFLSNRVHPNGKGSVNPLIGQIGTIAADSVQR